MCSEKILGAFHPNERRYSPVSCLFGLTQPNMVVTATEKKLGLKQWRVKHTTNRILFSPCVCLVRCGWKKLSIFYLFWTHPTLPKLVQYKAPRNRKHVVQKMVPPVSVTRIRHNMYVEYISLKNVEFCFKRCWHSGKLETKNYVWAKVKFGWSFSRRKCLSINEWSQWPLATFVKDHFFLSSVAINTSLIIDT